MIMKKIFWGPTMKLFINTAGLCIIPKLVNAAEKKLKELATPDIIKEEPKNPEIDQAIYDEMMQDLALDALTDPNRTEDPDQILKEISQADVTKEINSAIAKSIIENASTNPELIRNAVNHSAGPMDIPPAKHIPEVDEDGVINPQAKKEGIVQGTGCTTQESTMGDNYNKAHKKKNGLVKRVPTQRKPRDNSKITQDDWDYANKIWKQLQEENAKHPSWTVTQRYNYEHVTEMFNRDLGRNKSVKAIGRLITKPTNKTYIARIDCPPYEKEVTGSGTNKS